MSIGRVLDCIEMAWVCIRLHKHVVNEYRYDTRWYDIRWYRYDVNEYRYHISEYRYHTGRVLVSIGIIQVGC